MTLKLLGLSLLLLATFVVWTALRANVREVRARTDFPPEGQFVEVDERRVHAVVQGNGPDLVLIHGLTGNTRDFTFSLAGQLAETYRVIIFDRPGLGWSDRLPRGQEGITDQARHLQAAATKLGAEQPLVLGQSYGGSVALAWAVHHPEDIAGLVTLAAPSHVWDGPLPVFYKITSHPVGAALVVPLITAFVGAKRVTRAIEEVFAPQAMPAGYDTHFGAPLSLAREALRANAQHRVSLKSEIVALQSQYKNLTLPMEVLHGTADDIVFLSIHAERMVQDTQAAHLTVLEGIGHMPHHVAQEDVLAAVGRAAQRAGLR